MQWSQEVQNNMLSVSDTLTKQARTLHLQNVSQRSKICCTYRVQPPLGDFTLCLCSYAFSHNYIYVIYFCDVTKKHIHNYSITTSQSSMLLLLLCELYSYAQKKLSEKIG